MGVSFSDFNLTPLTIYANSYFGKFYGSVKTGIKFYLPTHTTSYIEPQFVMNRWDYFKSFATFFEDVKPSYIVQNEKFWSINYHVSTSNRSKIRLDFTNGFNEDTYYQIDNFTNADTADYTSLLYYSPGFEFTLNTLNRKQFASAGMKLQIKPVLFMPLSALFWVQPLFRMMTPTLPFFITGHMQIFNTRLILCSAACTDWVYFLKDIILYNLFAELYRKYFERTGLSANSGF